MANAEPWHRGWRGDLACGLAAILVCGAGMWIPSPWVDEAATAHIISYPVRDMAELWRTIDANFAPYYLLMHALTQITGISPFWLRLPSVLAVGVGTAAMAGVGRLVDGSRGRLWCAACFALLPRTTAMGIEARPYALSAMFAALTLLLVVRQLTRVAARWEAVALVAVMAGAVAMHLFAALPIAGLVVAATPWLDSRRRLRLWGSAIAAAIACAPIAVIAQRQGSQIGWLADIDYSYADQLLVESWFTSRWNIIPIGADRSPYVRDVPLHVLAVSLAVVALVAIVAGVISGRRRCWTWASIAAVPVCVAVGVLWLVSILGHPIALGRYLTAAAPFFALLMALALTGLSRRWRCFFAALLAAGCLVLVVAQRQPYAKVWKEDYGFIASTIRAEASAGDGFVMEPGSGAHDSARNAVSVYPATFAPLIDIAGGEPPALRDVFTPDPPVAELDDAELPQRVWVVAKNDGTGPYREQLTRLGWRIEAEAVGPGHTVTGWEKPGH